jgi:hypothetical protein
MSDGPVSRRTPKIKRVMESTYGNFRQTVGKMEEYKQVHTKSGHLLKIRVMGYGPGKRYGLWSRS